MGLRADQLAVVVAVRAVMVMDVSLDEVVGMIAVRNCGMAARA